MKALILIGGLGTRMLPLSRKLPKSLLPVLDRELLHYQITQLTVAGISEIILATGHLDEQVSAFLHGYSGNLNFIISHEAEPLGTGGAIANARRHFAGEDVVVLNADILSSINIAHMIEQHNASNASASIAGYAVDDPARYGLLDVIGGWVTGFREKPDAVSPEDKYLINAGVYILGNRFYDNHLPEGKSSIEREGFPAAIAGADPPHCYEHGGYWIDIGTFESYFEANFSLLNRYYMEGADWLWGERNDTAVFKDQIYLNKSCRLGKHVDLFHRVIMMSETRVGDRCRLQNTITMGNCCIGDNCRLENCIIGPSARVAAGSELANTVVVADEEDTPFYPGSHEIAP